MIAVIADDLSGAAELASAAARLGISAEVQTKFDPKSTADVIAIDADTRLLTAHAAASVMKDIAGAVMAAKPAWIFKKTDSILRGNVRSEIEAILDITGQQQALLISANPTRNRIIRGGHYFVENSLLHETHFSRDPHHPRKSSRIAELLGLGSGEDRIVTPDAQSEADLNAAAASLSADCLPAGGVDFFEAILKSRGEVKNVPTAESVRRGNHRLFLCGSAAAWEGARAARCQELKLPVFTMPFDLSAISQSLKQHSSVMMAIGTDPSHSYLTAGELLSQFVNAAIRVLSERSLPEIDEICVEGGATASALFAQLGCTRLAALTSEFAFAPIDGIPGSSIVRIKPGSYPWPAEIL